MIEAPVLPEYSKFLVIISIALMSNSNEHPQDSSSDMHLIIFFDKFNMQPAF